MKDCNALAGLVLAVSSWAGAACTSQPSDGTDSEPATRAPAASVSPARVQDGPLEQSPALGQGSANTSRFAQSLAAAASPDATIGVLPMVYFAPGAQPSVPQLGLDAADAIAEELVRLGHAGVVLSPTEMNLFLNDLNVDQTTLYSLPSILSEGDRLGVDVIVFGTIRKPNVLAAGQNPLAFEISAFDVLLRREIGRKEAFELPNKAVNERAFDLVEVATTWTAGTSLANPGTGDLAKELEAACRQLAKRIARLSAVPTIGTEKVIYVAPADSSRFVSAVSELRSMQKTLWQEIADREAETPNPGEPSPMLRPLVVNGTEFANVQQARDFVNRFQEDLLNTNSFRIGQQIASNLVEELRPLMDPRQVVNDLGFLSLSDTDQIEGELATGGLARSQKVRNLLAKDGVALVIQPRFERTGEHYSLRVEVYDLLATNTTFSTHFRIDRRCSAKLAEALEVRAADGAPAAELRPLSVGGDDWADLNDVVSSGIVRIVGTSKSGEPLGHGTGFLVAPNVVMTNSHVLAGLKSAPAHAVELAGDRVVQVSALEVLADDPFQDVAILRIAGLPSDLHVFEFAPRERARVGADVAVLGHPKEFVGQVFARGTLSSLSQEVHTVGARPRTSYMYSCNTRQGNSGSPVLLRDGTVVAVNSHGMRSAVEVVDARGQSSQAVSDAGEGFVSELPGFAMGAPGTEAKKILESALKK